MGGVVEHCLKIIAHICSVVHLIMIVNKKYLWPHVRFFFL